jgi:hypothetical protein
MLVKGEVRRDYGGGFELKEATYPVSTGKHYQAVMVIQCACGEEFVARDSGGSIGETLWPLLSTAVPDDVPKRVAEAYRDAATALAAGSTIGALMAGRTALIRMLRDKGTS